MTPNKLIFLGSGFVLYTGLVFGFGVKYEGNRIEAKNNKAIVAQVPKLVAKTEQTAAAVQNEGVKNNEKADKLAADLAAANNELGRLRIKRPAACPKPAADTSGIATASEAPGPANGPTASEINLDEVAGDIIELGGDLDKQYLRIEYLQGLLKVYADKNTCKLE